MLSRLEKILLFLVVLFLPTQLGKHFWPDFSYIYSLRIDYLSPTLYFWDLLVVLLLVVWILNKPRVNKLALNLFLVFLLTQGLSLLAADNPGAGLVRLEQYLLAGSFGVFLASQDFKGLLKRIYWPLSLGILGESVIAVLQFIKGGSLGLWILGERNFSISTPGIAKFDFYGWEFLRPYGTFPHPNVLAGFMLIGIVILSATKDLSLASLSRRSGRIRVLLKQVLQSNYFVEQRFFPRIKCGVRMTIFDVLALLGGLSILLTMSRVVMMAGFAATLAALKGKWRVALVILILVLSPVLFTRFFSLFNFDSLTLLRREELLGNAWQIFLRYPIFGVGLNNFIPAMASDLVTGPSRFLQPVHNIFLLALSETGLIGLMGLVFLIGFPVIRILKLHPLPFTLHPILPWLILIFLGLFDHYFLTLPQGYRLLFLVWGLSLFPRLNRGSMLK